MSRVGKYPVAVPAGVTVEIANDTVTAKGKLGELSAPITSDVEVTVEGNLITVRPAKETKSARAMWGTMRSPVNTHVTRVSTGFKENGRASCGARVCQYVYISVAARS